MRAFLLSIIVLVSLNSYAGGIEAVQLDYVPIDVSLKCDRIFFKSTQHFKGTIYSVPRVIPERDIQFEDVVRIVRNPKQTEGKPYILGFSMYFPRDDEEIKSKTTYADATKFKACNFDQVKSYLNAIDPVNPVHTVASMPITSFEVSFPDLLIAKKLVGRTSEEGDADIIDYQGKTFDLVFEITEKEAAAIRESPNSLQALVRFKFQARRRDGSLSIKIDNSKLAMAFEAKVKGKYKIAKGDIEATLRAAVESMDVQINAQGGSDAANAVAEKIISKVLSELNLTIKDVLPGDKTQVEDPKEEIDVKIVADIIKNKVSQNIEYNNVKNAEEASAVTTLTLDSGSLDPNIVQAVVVSGEGDYTLVDPILKDDVISINPAFFSSIHLKYEDKLTYLSLEQVKSDSYSQYFIQMLTSGNWVIENEVRYGFPVAVARPTLLYSPKEYFTTEYVYRRIEKIPKVVYNPRQTFEAGLDQFDRFPVAVSFTGVGNQRKRFRFEELLGENEYWKATYDDFTGSIKLIAKQDLGLMVFKERFKLGRNNDALASEEEKVEHDFKRDNVPIELLVREKITSFTDIEDSEPQEIRHDNKATLRKRVVYFNITREKLKTGATNEN